MKGDFWWSFVFSGEHSGEGHGSPFSTRFHGAYSPLFFLSSILPFIFANFLCLLRFMLSSFCCCGSIQRLGVWQFDPSFSSISVLLLDPDHILLCLLSHFTGASSVSFTTLHRCNSWFFGEVGELSCSLLRGRIASILGTLPSGLLSSPRQHHLSPVTLVSPALLSAGWVFPVFL